MTLALASVDKSVSSLIVIGESQHITIIVLASDLVLCFMSLLTSLVIGIMNCRNAPKRATSRQKVYSFYGPVHGCLHYNAEVLFPRRELLHGKTTLASHTLIAPRTFGGSLVFRPYTASENYLRSELFALHIGRSDVTIICSRITISALWGSTV